MVSKKYTDINIKTDKMAKAKGSHLRTSFKNTSNTANAIVGKDLKAAKSYLEAVLEGKRCIVFRKYNGGVGRTAQAKNEGSRNGQGRWPKKSVEFVLNLLKNAEANAEADPDSGIDIDKLYVKTCQVQRAPHGRRRTHRAHGRVNPYLSSPCHIELVLAERKEAVVKEKGALPALSRKQAARMLRTGIKPRGGY